MPSTITTISKPRNQAQIRPRIADRVHLALPNLPDPMCGATILHLSDLHIRRNRPWYRRLIDMCSRERPDFVWMTGDYMTVHGDERHALRVMGDLADAMRPNVGSYASFGNHDTPAFKRLARKHIDQVTWLEHEALVLPEWAITLLGTSTPCDILRCLRHARQLEQERGVTSPYRIVLGHEPTILPTCAQLGIEWLLAGHTHGGQLRLGLPFAILNGCDLPRAMSSGILRCRDSVCTISRGLGESYFDFRFLCPPHLPMYVLERGPLPPTDTRKMHCTRWW